MNVTEVSRRLGRPITDPNEVTQVNAWINDVKAIIRARFPHIDTHLIDGTVSTDAYEFVVCSVVERKVRNPDGKQNERIDDYSYGLTEDAARGGLFLTEEEQQLLTPGGNAGGAFSIIPAANRRRYYNPEWAWK